MTRSLSAVAVALLLTALLPAHAGAAGLPAGEYGCYTYNPRANYVGGLVIRGDSYQSRTGASGRYRLADGGKVEFLGEAPLGFAVAVLEETEPTPKLRLYRQAADIGNKWKAAVCSLDGGRQTGSGGAAAGSTAPTGAGPSAGAKAPAGAASGTGGFAAGQRVEATFIGVWYKASVVRCDSTRCLLHYDDPSSKDEWVDQSRLRAR